MTWLMFLSAAVWLFVGWAWMMRGEWVIAGLSFSICIAHAFIASRSGK